MTIIERLRQYKELDPHKIALIVDDKKYTYGDLYDAILSIDINDTSRIVNVAQTKESPKHIVALIQSQSFVEQLVQWLGDCIPVIFLWYAITRWIRSMLRNWPVL